MKRILIVLLLLTVFMSSCESTDHMQTDVDTELAVSTPVFNIDGDLPDIGEFAGNKPQERFYEEYTPDFIPSDEYGEIIPFVGGRKIYHNTDSSIKQSCSAYGFCTPDGKIVMDASNNNMFVSVFKTNDHFVYYTLTRKIVQTQETSDENFVSETAIIPQNGKWSITLPSHAWVNSAGDGIITVLNIPPDGRSVLTVYDYNGNEITNLSGVNGAGKYSNGLLLIRKRTDENFLYYYTNLDGESLLGPYKHAIDFNQSKIASVTDMNGENYLIGTDGKRLSNESYSVIYSHISDDSKTQFFVANRLNNQRLNDIYDNTGKLIGTIEGGRYPTLHFTKNGDIIYQVSNTQGNITSVSWKRMSDNSYFLDKEHGVSPDALGSTNNVYIGTTAESRIIFDENGDTIAVLDNEHDFSAISTNNKYLVYISGEYAADSPFNIITDTRNLHIYNTETKEIVYTIASYGYASFVGKNERYIIISHSNSNNPFGDAGLYSMFDTQANTVLFENSTLISCFQISGKDYFNICTKNTNTLYDENFNVILKTYSE